MADRTHTPRLYAAAIAAAAELREKLRAGSTGPWSTAAMHGRDITDEGWSEVVVLAESAPARRGSDYPGRIVAMTAAMGFEDNEEPEADASLIAAAVNALPHFLDLVDAILAMHKPVVDPDGQAVCEHCVSTLEPLLMWPCFLVDGVLDALGVPAGEEVDG